MGGESTRAGASPALKLGMKYPILLFLLLTPLFALPAYAEDGWVFQGSVGAVANLETSLEIRQEDFETLELDADYETRPFEFSTRMRPT
jgi:hypothetical protein